MIVIRPTASLAKKMGLKLVASPEESDNRLGDWFANDISLGSRRLILCVSSRTRLPILLNAAPYKAFPERLASEVEKVLLSFGFDRGLIKQEIDSMGEVKFAKTNSPSILGSVNDFGKLLKFRYFDGRIDFDCLMRESCELAETPILVMKAVYPTEAAAEIFGFRPQVPSNVVPLFKTQTLS